MVDCVNGNHAKFDVHIIKRLAYEHIDNGVELSEPYSIEVIDTEDVYLGDKTFVAEFDHDIIAFLEPFL